MTRKKRGKKSTPLKLLEYALALVLISAVRFIPLPVIRFISTILGDLLFFLAQKRRTIAMENLTHALGKEKGPSEVRRLARESCRSFFLTFLEIVRYRALFSGPDAAKHMASHGENLEALFLKAKKIHDESGGCIFVTPHIGNWEVLPRVCSAIGIPLAIVARPLDNEYLEELVFRSRVAEGQFIIPKKNALFLLQKTLQKGTSIGMLPDQSTMKGMLIDFFGRPATTTPVPAILAITYNRPIVVTAACRAGKGRYEGFVSDPIWPGSYDSEKGEIRRITEEMTRAMEAIIRKYPGQYLWMHNRWKTYKNKKEVMT